MSRPNLKITPHIWEGHPWSFLYLPKRQYPYKQLLLITKWDHYSNAVCNTVYIQKRVKMFFSRLSYLCVWTQLLCMIPNFEKKRLQIIILISDFQIFIFLTFGEFKYRTKAFFAKIIKISIFIYLFKHSFEVISWKNTRILFFGQK